MTIAASPYYTAALAATERATRHLAVDISAKHARAAQRRLCSLVNRTANIIAKTVPDAEVTIAATQHQSFSVAANTEPSVRITVVVDLAKIAYSATLTYRSLIALSREWITECGKPAAVRQTSVQECGAYSHELPTSHGTRDDAGVLARRILAVPFAGR